VCNNVLYKDEQDNEWRVPASDIPGSFEIICHPCMHSVLPKVLPNLMLQKL